MSEIPCDLIREEVAEVMEDHGLTPANERKQPVPPAVYIEALSDVLERSEESTSSKTEFDIVMAAMVNRLREKTGDPTFDGERLKKSLIAERARKRIRIQAANAFTRRLHY